MKIFYSIEKWQAFRKTDFFINKTIGLVMTMGNLHSGHQSLLQKSAQENVITVLTIFINPTQFNNSNDLQNYPKTLEADLKLAELSNVDCVLVPQYEEVYPDNYRYKVSEIELSKQLCGKHRAGHFDGVLTVVLKLLMLIKAHYAYFGEKDFQQLQLVHGLVKAFFLDTKIVACPTIRNEQGLALSSRNNLLTSDQLQLALQFPALLSSNLTIPEIINKLIALGFTVDYIEECDGRRFGAVKLENVRLIDNCIWAFK